MPEPSTNSTVYAKTAGLILAGGAGARLGQVRKSDLCVGGHRLLDLACGNLGGQVGHIFIAGGGQPVAPPATKYPFSFVVDPGRGPAAALLVAAHEIGTRAPGVELVMVVPCDAPFMPSDFAELAAAALDSSTAAIAGTFGGRSFPTHVLWRMSALLDLREQVLPTGNPAIFALLDRVQHKTLPFDTLSADNPFFNINTPADLVAANRRFAAASTPSFS